LNDNSTGKLTVDNTYEFAKAMKEQACSVYESYSGFDRASVASTKTNTELASSLVK
jgi:hypothetical protein